MSVYNDLQTVKFLNCDTDAINDAIRNILMTPKGTLPGKPKFGSRLHELIFSQIDDLTLKLFKDLVIEALQYWENRIAITAVECTADESTNTLKAEITYYYYLNGIKENSTTVAFSY